MSGELQAYLGRFEIGADAQTFTMVLAGGGSPAGTQTVTLDSGEYYMSGHTGESVNQCVEETQEKIRQHGGDFAAVTVTHSLSTGLVTFAGFGVNVTITWSDQLLAQYFGFTGAILSGATSFVAPNPARFVWRPSLSPSVLPVDLTTFWEPRSNSSLHIAPDGATEATVGALQSRAAIAYDLLDLDEVLVESAGLPAGNGTFEQYYRDVFHNAMPSRIILDRTSYASTSDYKVGLFGHESGTRSIGALRDWISPVHGERSHDLWDVDLFFAEYTGAGV
jgi:hypothetical protein